MLICFVKQLISKTNKSFICISNMHLYSRCFIVLAFLFSCKGPEPTYVITGKGDTLPVTPQKDLPLPPTDANGHYTTIQTGQTTPDELISFAISLTGVPYKYGSTDPQQGFDCSGFITYVFNHFGIQVPRTSVDFTYVNREISLQDAKTGDLVLFTGTDSTIRVVGHMGIIIARTGQPLTFIHSTSGKAMGVTETPLNTYYMGRYVKTIRVFAANDR
ncbi:NlpC/P60 family protein [Inquilinus sp. KBS0705]|nr:NlpC/P60 family protein [Inquilinus sp. KBS0705]